MSLAPDVCALLASFEEAGVRPYDELSVIQARGVVESARRLQGPKAEVAAVRDFLVCGSDGQLPARGYWPTASPEVGRAPIVYFHGGGWVTGSVAIADRPCRQLALYTQRVVVSVDYRLAPETRFPGQTEDAYAALQDLPGVLGSYGVYVSDLIVAGDSAGGALAAATTLMTRDRGGTPVSHQLLMYPVLSPARGNTSESYRTYGDGYVLTSGSLVWFFDHYLGPEQDGREPYASPLLTPELDDLPPATIVTAEYDPLRDDAFQFADRLRSAGVPVDHRHFEDQSHGFFWMGGALAGTQDLLDYLAERLG